MLWIKFLWNYLQSISLKFIVKTNLAEIWTTLHVNQGCHKRQGFSPATMNVCFHRKIEEKCNQKKSLAAWFPAYLLYLPGNLTSLMRMQCLFLRNAVIILNCYLQLVMDSLLYNKFIWLNVGKACLPWAQIKSQSSHVLNLMLPRKISCFLAHLHFTKDACMRSLTFNV